MHIYSMLNKLLAPKVEQPDIQNNTNEQNKNIQDKKQEKFTASSNNIENKNKPPFNKNKQYENKAKEPQDTCYVLFPKDGDSFLGMYKNAKTEFRLAGVDTPEKGSPWAKQATFFLKDTIGKKVVYLTVLGKDTYDREIVEVYLDKEKTQSVNKMLLEKGLASSERYTNSEGKKTHNIVEYAKNEITETTAKLKGKGMWGGLPNEADVEEMPDDIDTETNIQETTTKIKPTSNASDDYFNPFVDEPEENNNNKSKARRFPK